MEMPSPIYTLSTCPNPAYQLNWSYTIFWHQRPTASPWLEALQLANEPDGIRILQHQFAGKKASQFLVSTKPHVAPRNIVQRIKGRLQAQLRPTQPNAFQRNYALRSIGAIKRSTVDTYVAGQVQHHLMADERVSKRLEDYKFFDKAIDLAKPTHTSHGIFWHNLHLVLVNAERHRNTDDARLRGLHQMIRSVARKKGYGLSRIGMLADHLHITLRGKLDDSPADIALGYLNNLAYVMGMRAEFCFSYYVGTFGEYTIRAIPRV